MKTSPHKCHRCTEVAERERLDAHPTVFIAHGPEDRDNQKSLTGTVEYHVQTPVAFEQADNAGVDQYLFGPKGVKLAFL